LPRVAGSLINAVPSGVGTGLVTMAQQQTPTTQRGAIGNIAKATLAGTTDVLLSGITQTAKEAFAKGKEIY